MAGLTADFDYGYSVRGLRALVVADDAARGRDAADALRGGGCEVRSPATFAEAAQDRTIFEGVRLLWIEGAGAAEDLFDLMLMRADTLAGERHSALVVSVEAGQIDVASAHIASEDVQLLCDPTPYERASAVAIARLKLEPVVNDISQEREAVRLQRMHEEVARLAETLVRIARGEDGERSVRASEQSYRGPDEAEVEIAAAEIRSLIRARRLRAQFFGEGLLEDPAWDMLLDLFAAELERRRVSVSSLCIAAAVAPTTALRWIGKMHHADLLQRQADPNDRRRAYISLTPRAGEAMRRYVAAARRQGLPLA